MAIWRPTNDTPLVPLRTPFGLLADSVEADLDARGFTRYPTKADMTAYTDAANGTHATVYADSNPYNNGDYVWFGAWTRPLQVNGAEATLISGSTVSHGLGRTPISVVATISKDSPVIPNLVRVSTSNPTSTTFKVTFYRSDSNIEFVDNLVKFYWMAL